LILQIKGLVKDFEGLRALSNVDIEIQKGEIFGLIGPNGSGKTTLLNIITGFLKPTAGYIIYKGRSIGGLKPHVIAKKGVIRTFQISNIFPGLTATETIIAGRYLEARSSIAGAFFHTRGYKREEVELKQKAAEILAILGLQEKGYVLANALGAGEQRKLQIATALAAEPELLLLDEPASGLNTTEAEEMVHLLRSIQKAGRTLLVVEHNMKVMMSLCTRIAALDYGSKIAEGTPEEIVKNDKVISTYLGKDQKSV
jgi:branched-chain amino acid transport system ATP-binding protein